MGMCKLQGGLPLKPTGIENLGKATNNICEAGALYSFAHPTDYGQRMPNKETYKDMAGPDEEVTGQNVTLNLETLYLIRNRQRNNMSSRHERRQQQLKTIAHRKARKNRKRG